MPGRDTTRHTTPSELGDASWITAPVPGTAATALRAAGTWNGASPLELDNHDVWYRVRFAGGGAEVLRFEGLATIADVWLNGEHLLRSESMFLPCEVTVWTQRANTLFICFRSLTAWLEGTAGPRALAYTPRSAANATFCANDLARPHAWLVSNRAPCRALAPDLSRAPRRVLHHRACRCACLDI